MIEVRTDSGDFAEIWVNGKLAIEACSDEQDLEPLIKTVKVLATALNIPVTVSNDYEWDEGLKQRK